jgi:hypothetical protein
VARVGFHRLAPVKLGILAFAELKGVGDPGRQWAEWTGRAYHLRRRLTPEEEKATGPAVDCRGTGEWGARYYEMAHRLPETAKRLARLEMEAP